MPLNRAHRAHAATHHGVFALRDLRRLGASDHQIERWTRSGELLHPTTNVYVLNGVTPSYDQRIGIACAAHGGVVASHRTAARVLGLRRVGTTDGVEVTLAGDSGIRPADVIVHHTRLLRPCDVIFRPDGIRHTTAARTLFDLSATLPDDAVESIMEQILDRRLHTLPELHATARELRARGRPGSSRFGRVLGSRPAWRRPAASDLEVRLDIALRRRGMPMALRRVEVTLPDRSTIHPDLWWPQLRLAVEVDHVGWHGGRVDSQYDKRRDRQVARLGVQTIRVTDLDVKHQLHAAVDDILAIARLRVAA